MTPGEFFKLLREQREWTQTQLSEKSGVDASQISRMEKGRVDSVSDDVVTKLCKAFNISKDDYNNAMGVGASAPSVEIRIGFGHSIWSAPVVKLIMEDGGAQGVLLTSFGEKETSEEVAFKPYFYNQEEYFRLGRIPLPKEWDSTADEKKTSFVLNIKYFSADTLLNLVNADRLDGIIVPGSVYDDHWLSLERAAQITYTNKGNIQVFVAYHPDVEFEGGTITNRSLSKFLEEYEGPIELLYARRTIAEKYLHKQMLNFLSEATRASTVKSVIDASDIGKLHEAVARSIHKSKDERNPRVLIFLTWEPHASWLLEMVDALSGGKWRTGIVDSYNLGSRGTGEIFLAMDVLFKKDKLPYLMSQKKDVIRNFFQCLHAAIRRLTDKSDLESEAEIIGEYLGMKKERTTQILKDIHFRLMYYPEWVELLSQK